MKHIAILTVFLAVFLFFAYPNINPGPFVYDEADYMFAAGRGFLANYLDSPSLSFVAYVRLGLSGGRDKSQASALSLSVRRAGDMFLYRHAHGPVYFYWLSALSHWTTSEHFIRILTLIFPAITALAIYFGCLWILPPPQGSLAAILGTALYLWNAAVVRSTELAPHQMFTMWFIVTLMLLAKLLETGSRTLWYAAVCITAIAFCTFEVTFVLMAIVLVCGYLERRRLGFDGRFAATSAMLFAATVAILHPAAITKLAFAKSYLFYAYLAVGRKAPWGNATLLHTWIARFSNSPVEWLLIAVALLVWIGYRNLPGRRQAVPFLLFGGLMLATMLRVLTTGPRYTLPFLPALLVFAALVISGVLMRWRPAARAGATVVVCVALLFSAYRYMAAHPFAPDRQTSDLLAQVRQRNLGAGKLLVPHDFLPTLHYYFPATDLTPYDDESALPAGHFDAVVRIDDSVRIDPAQ